MQGATGYNISLVSNGYTSGLTAVAVLAVSSKSCSESFLARISLYARLFGQLITITPPPPPPPPAVAVLAVSCLSVPTSLVSSLCDDATLHASS